MPRRKKPDTEGTPHGPKELSEKDLFTEGLVLNEPSTLPTDGEAEWIRLQGATPLEFLAGIYKCPFQETRDRINAAKAILDYVHRKLPQRVEVEGTMRDTRKITADNLARLSDQELEAFTALLGKLGE